MEAQFLLNYNKKILFFNHSGQFFALTNPGFFFAALMIFFRVSRFRSSNFFKRMQLLPTLTFPKSFLCVLAKYFPFTYGKKKWV